MQCQSDQASPYLMKEGSTCQHHGQLTGVVGVVQPGLVRDVPRVVTAREPNNAVPCFPPHPSKTQVYAHLSTKLWDYQKHFKWWPLFCRLGHSGCVNFFPLLNNRISNKSNRIKQITSVSHSFLNKHLLIIHLISDSQYLSRPYRKNKLEQHRMELS